MLHTEEEQQDPESQEPASDPHLFWADTSERRVMRERRASKVRDVLLCMAEVEGEGGGM